MSAIRSTIPRATLALHARQLQSRWAVQIRTRAASTTPPKPRVLEQPERFNPPSHSSRIARKPKYYGPELNQREKAAQKTRTYPHMMPPEGTFLHWFLTNRRVHLYISMSILVSLVLAIWYQDFVHNTPYLDLLPPNSMIFSHPIIFFRRWGEVYLMHVQHVSRETAERRKHMVDDAQKQKEFRKAHGLQQSGTVFDKLVQEEEGPRSGGIGNSGTAIVDDASPKRPVAEDESYVDFDGQKQPARKKLFGIW